MGGHSKGECQQCGSSSVTTERIVEHRCGHVSTATAVEDGPCPKCGQSTRTDTLAAVNTVCRCRDCGRRFEVESEPAGTALERREITFPELPTPTPGGELSWLPDRYLPTSDHGQRLLASVLVVVILLSGVAVAISVSTVLESEQTDAAPIDRTWEEYDTIVIFRNDDIQPWYNPEAMRAVDQVFIEEEVPVTLGIIPMVGGEQPITADETTCSYLRSLETEYPGQFEMALHGYTHEAQTDFYNGSEFGGMPATTQAEWLAAGEELMHDCVDRPSKTFIPPMNTYDESTVDVLAEAEYSVVSGGDWFTSMQYNATPPFEADGIRHVPETQAFENWTAAEDGTDEVPLYDLETLTDSFDRSVETNAVHVQMIHYQYFTSDQRLERLRSLIQHMKATDDVTFMTLEQFDAGLEADEIEETDDGWRVLEPIEATTANRGSVAS
ncbi:DUF2334 domain-containing protein [Natronorubrum sulfidifaciens]|uniref:Polysaccharide deacetylase n=1 Tax=Natronorubrum sulfidifaciens JCM 14089 TaxID=1230460 RepID=L9WE66_9EURY|nr:DUF2334 domain-containing protein [Natronorubrum sulfidifaciens]ELY47642.1 polysaccharide deacetylase [Natronorubrum sulfidifaciens JCM 14089]